MYKAFIAGPRVYADRPPSRPPFPLARVLPRCPVPVPDSLGDVLHIEMSRIVKVTVMR